jgi:hypothetical protein
MCYACGHKLREDEAAEASAAEAADNSEEEIPCPSCNTMVSRDAVMCYACGVNIKEASAKAGTVAPAEDADKSGALKRPQIFVKKIVKKKTA